MNRSGGAAAAAATAPTEDRLGSDASAPSSGIEYLDAWRVAVRPFPGSVPPFAGFSPTDTNSPVADGADGDVVGAAIAAAVAAIESLGSIDATDVEPGLLAQLVEGVEQARRMIDAAATAPTGVAGVIDARNPFRTSHGYLNARTFLTQRAQLSGPEAHRRLQTARMRTRLPEWATAAHTGTVGIAQSEAMARVAANTRIDPDVLARDAGMLLDDAISLPYTDFERNLRTWEALADPDGDHTRNERATARRDINLHPRPHGGWNVTGTSGATPDPRRFRNVVSRTKSGRRLHPDDTINTALVNHIRRVVYDSSGTIIELGRRSRLFRGSSRDAVMLLLTMCVWIGCDQPVAWCDADHSLGWKAHGATVPRNGQPLYTGHQNLKETGFQVHRDDHGHWHITDPEGNEIT